jgi:thioredoxin 1
MVHKMLREAALLLAITLFLAGCSKSESSQAVGPDAAGNTLVTFVELGSVGCIPCRMMQPIMREIEGTYSGQVRVVFHDVWTEEGKPFVKKYGVRVIPTQVFLDAKGVEYFRHEGFFPREQLVAVLKAKGVK